MTRKSYNKLQIGRYVKSLREWCALTGVDPDRARARMSDLHWPPDQAVGLKPRQIDLSRAHANTFDGEAITLTWKRKTKTLRQWHEETGIRLRTLYWRYNRGWNPADILDPDRKNSRAKQMERTREKRRNRIAAKSAKDEKNET